MGQPNKDAVGIINDAFDEPLPEDVPNALINTSQGDDFYGSGEADVSVVDESVTGSERSDATNALHTGSLATHETTGAETAASAVTFGATDSGVAIASNLDDLTDCGKDPFDTSDFDSAAFDAFATKFDATAETGDNSGASAYDPFASPMKSVPKGKDDSEADVFDIFDPYASRPATKTPKNTPMKICRTDQDKDSFDDDEPDNLRIVIRAKMKSNTGADGDIIPSLGKILIRLNVDTINFTFRMF